MKFIIFSWNKYDNIWRKLINDINEIDNIKLQIGNKVKKLKLFLAKVSLEALNIFTWCEPLNLGSKQWK